MNGARARAGRKANFKINYEPHAGQIEVRRGIRNSGARIINVTGSRGWGKSVWATCDVAVPGLFRKPNQQILYVAPYYKHCKSVIDDVWYGVDEETGERFIPDRCPDTGFRFWEYKASDKELHAFNKSVMYMRSADNPDSIVSKGYNIIIIDEAALIPQDVFQKQILPTARRKDCIIIIISTPRGKNWFHQVFLRGQDPSQKNYISFKQPWWKRPDYPDLLKEEMRNLPEHIRKQEFEAEFIDDSGGTFANLPKVFWGEEIYFESDQQTWEHPRIDEFLEHEDFTLAVDIAKKNDYTVVSVWSNVTREMVYYWRMNKTDYKVVLDRIHRIARRFHDADIIYDATGVGDSFGDFLSSDFNCHPFVFTNKSKNEIVNQLIIATEYGNIKMPNIQTIRHEFELFEFKVTRTGAMTYAAPEGYHDDCVMSVALGNWYVQENGGTADIREIDNFLQVANGGAVNDFYDFIDQDND